MDLTWSIYLVPKDYIRYYSATTKKYYPILGKHSDREIMDSNDKVTDEE